MMPAAMFCIVLRAKLDREAGRAEHCDDARGFDAELRQRADDRDDADAPTATSQRIGRSVSSTRLVREQTVQPVADAFRQPPAGDEQRRPAHN